MPLVIPTDFAHVQHQLQYLGDAELMVITYGVETDIAAPPTSASDLAGDLAAVFDAEVMPLVSVDITLVGTEVTWQMTPAPDAPLIGFSAIGGSGGAAGTLIPQNSAFLVHKRSNFGGRGGRGRCYIPGVQEGNVSNVGVVAPATVTAWNTALEDWRLGIIGAPGVDNMAILHDSNGAFAATAPRPVSSITMDPVIATQRRRLRH